jgi:hypothetical protein
MKLTHKVKIGCLLGVVPQNNMRGTCVRVRAVLATTARASVRLRAGLLRDKPVVAGFVQSLGNQSPSRLVRLCQTIFLKKIKLPPMISNQFQSLFNKL